MTDESDNRCACGKRNRCPLGYGETIMAFPQKTPLLVRRDPPETDDGKCHITPILDGVEGIGFECNGEGPVIDRTLRQLHFAADPDPGREDSLGLSGSPDVAHGRRSHFRVLI